jgi:DNA (cytosine-5)-methyltransferase 1
MADYGVPQTRRRTVFVGSRITTHFSWPEPTREKGNYVTVKEALEDLPWELGRYFSHRANSQMRGPRNRKVDKDPAFTLRVRGDEFAFCKRPATGAFAPNLLPETELVYHPMTSDYQRIMRRKAPTGIKPAEIPAASRSKMNFKGTRRLAIREMARLQSFPDWFEFSGTKYSQAKQIGNAVPPLFAEKLFDAIFKQHQALQDGLEYTHLLAATKNSALTGR